MLSLLMPTTVRANEEWNGNGLPASEYLDVAMRRSREERLQESRHLEDGIRAWWLVEQGWLVPPRADSPPSAITLAEHFLRIAGGLLISCGVWLKSRSAASADQAA